MPSLTRSQLLRLSCCSVLLLATELVVQVVFLACLLIRIVIHVVISPELGGEDLLYMFAPSGPPAGRAIEGGVLLT